MGKVEGLTKKQFVDAIDEPDLWRDSLLHIASIVKSSFPIEIRLYESGGAIAVQSCTTLYYDTGFHVTRVMKTYHGWEKANNVEAYNPLKNADTVFNEIVKNGIFNLPEYGNYDSDGKVLTTKGFIKSGVFALCGVTDGLSYKIQIKLRDVYKTIYFSSREEAQLRCYPDNDIIRRKMNVVEQLKPNARLVKK